MQSNLKFLRCAKAGIAAFFLTLWTAHAVPADLPQAPDDPAAQARVIVKFKEGAATLRRHALSARQMHGAASAEVLNQRAFALGRRHGRTLAAGRGITERMQVVTARGVDSATLARSLASDSEVEYAEVDQRRQRVAVPNDPLYGPVSGTSPATGQWYLKAPTAASAQVDSDVVSSINAPAAWDLTTGSPGIVIAVIDSGVRADHADLAGKVLSGYDMITNVTLANDGTGRDSDASDPGDYVSASDVQGSTFASCSIESSSWHGTMVSGLVAAASNNGIGMAGMAWNSKVLPVRVLGKCFGYDSDIIAGMRWAAGLPVTGLPANTTPARVLNLSLGGGGNCTAAYTDAIAAINAAGAVVVVAAGNGSGQALNVPANCPGVIAVTGLRHAGTKVGFANIGPGVSIAAPGGNCVNTSGECLYPMLSTTNPGTTTPVTGSAGSTYTNGTNYAVGTSFSAPLVAGTAALMLSANPALTPSLVSQLIKTSARPFPSTGGTAGTAACQAPSGAAQLECYCTTTTCGAGMLDTGAAVQAAASLVAGATGPLLARIDASPAVPDPGTVVVLSAANTRLDTGRSVVSHSWSLVSGGGIVSGFAGATDGVTATVTPSAVGSFTVGLTVVDDLGATSTRQVTVAVDTLSVEAIASRATVGAGTSVTLSAANLQLSPGRSVAAYGWSLLDGDGAVDALPADTSGGSITLVPTASGRFSVRLTVTDDLGKQATADVQVLVTDTASSAAATSATATSPAAGGGGGGGGGGGALSWPWIAALALGTAGLLAGRRRGLPSKGEDDADDGASSVRSRPLFLRGRSLRR